MRLWPKRSRDEKADDTREALIELAVSFGMLSAGLLLILAAGYFDGPDWLYVIGGLLAIIGVYAVFQSVLQLIIEVSVGMGVAMGVLSLAILGFALYNGYVEVMK